MSRVTSLADVHATLSRLATDRRDAVALISPDGRITTFGALHDRVTAAATRLREQGMQPRDNVMFSVRPSMEAILLLLATLRAGGTIVAADPGMGKDLLTSRMAAVKPKFVMAESLLYALSSSRICRRLLPGRGMELPQVARLPGCRFVRVGRWLPGTPASIAASHLMRPLTRESREPVALDADHPVFVVFTSGTTAEPRAVVHTARSIAAILDASHLISDLDSHSVVLTDQLHSAIPALLAGSRVVLPPLRAGPADVARLVHRSQVTHAFAVPSDLQRLVTYYEQRSQAFPSTLRQLVLGAGPVGHSLLARVHPFLPAATQVSCIYGLTEMAPVASVDMREKLEWGGEGDLVGSPLPGARVRIGEGGELCVSGDRLCGRYLGGEPLMEVATGDIARLDHDGRVVLLGRSKDMIIRGEHNIYPSLYEEKIANIPGVARCAMVGLWDERLEDERVVLVVEPTSRETNPLPLRLRLERALRVDSVIDRLALPDQIMIMPLPESGRARKIDRQALRHQLSESLV